MSKPGGHSSTAYSPTIGILADFENLFQHFESLKSVRYTHFVQVWKQFQMSCIYAGRQTDQECREFTEECLKLALAYCLDSSLQVKVFGLYLLYGLYFKYPFMPRVKIRVTSSDWEELMNMLGEIRKQDHLDAEFVFLKLRYDRAFQFVATRNECFPVRGSNHEPITDTQQQKLEMLIAQKSIISELFESDAIDQLAAIHEEYQRVKCALAGPNATKPSPELNVIENGLIHMLTKSVTSHEEWRKTRIGKKMGAGRRRRDSGGHTTSESEGDSEVEQDAVRSSLKSHGLLRAEIKARAFSSVGTANGSRRFRTPVALADDSSDKSPTKRSRGSAADEFHGPHFSPGFFRAVEDLSRERENERDSLCAASMPCLTTNDHQENTAYKKRRFEGLDNRRATKMQQVKKRGRPKKKIADVVDPNKGGGGDGDAIGRVGKKERRRKKDSLTGRSDADASFADSLVDENAAETSYVSPNAKRRENSVVRKSESKKRKRDEVVDANDGASPHKVSGESSKKKKRRKREKFAHENVEGSRSVDENNLDHSESDNLQELDITVDEHGAVHVHPTTDLLGSNTSASSIAMTEKPSKLAGTRNGAGIGESVSEPIGELCEDVSEKRKRSSKKDKVTETSVTSETNASHCSTRKRKRPKKYESFYE